MRRNVVGLVCIAISVGLFQPAFADPASGAATSDPVAQSPPPVQVTNKLKTKCTVEKTMGSHIKRKRCRSQEDIDRERTESKAFSESISDGQSNVAVPR